MFLGIEIGGTKLQLAFGSGNGSLAALWRGTVDPAAGSDGIRRQIQAAIPELLSKAQISGDQIRMAGIGFGGPVDDREQRIVKSHQIAGWDDFPLADWIHQIVGVPAVVGNDADVAGLGESLFGAGVGYSPLFYVTIGSGIGGGLIVEGEIYRASGRGAAEIGHLRMPSPEGGFVPLEQLASGWAIQSRYRRESGDDSKTTQDVAQAALAGEPLAQRILAEARIAFAEGLCHVIALLCPRRIVLGGGVSLMDESLWIVPLRKLVGERVFAPFAKQYSLATAKLGEESVLHGAIGLAAKRVDTERYWSDGEWSI